MSDYYNIPDVIELNKIVGSDPLEGNCMYKDKSNFQKRNTKEMINLRNNLVKLGCMYNNILEVGFNAGHSCALFAYRNKIKNFLIFDIGRWAYTQRCIDYFSSLYQVEYIKGDSKVTLPNYTGSLKVELIHIDGGHGVKTCELDIINCKKFANQETLVIIDDANFKRIRLLIEKFINEDLIIEIEAEDIGLRKTRYHRFFQYILA